MYQVTSNLFRGERPRDIRELLSRGFQQIICLQSGAEDKLTNSLYEFQLRSKRADPNFLPSIRLVDIPCSNFLPPTPFEVLVFLDAVSDGLKTYVHCHSGVDRTGFMIAVYRMRRLNWNFEDAHKEWVDLGRHCWFFWWKPFLRSCGN